MNGLQELRRLAARRKGVGSRLSKQMNRHPFHFFQFRQRRRRWSIVQSAKRVAESLPPAAARPAVDARDRRAHRHLGHLSIPTLDAQPWRATEPHTPHPRPRLEAVAELTGPGSPPGSSSPPSCRAQRAPRQIQPLLQAAADAGATGIGGIALHLRGEVRELFMDWLRSERPSSSNATRRSTAAARTRRCRSAGACRPSSPHARAPRDRAACAARAAPPRARTRRAATVFSRRGLPEQVSLF